MDDQFQCYLDYIRSEGIINVSRLCGVMVEHRTEGSWVQNWSMQWIFMGDTNP
jgi:hypothetical protein